MFASFLNWRCSSQVFNVGSRDFRRMIDYHEFLTESFFFSLSECIEKKLIRNNLIILTFHNETSSKTTQKETIFQTVNCTFSFFFIVIVKENLAAGSLQNVVFLNTC